MKHHFLLLGSSLLLAGAAQAQVTFSVGPRVGFSAARAYFPGDDSNTSASYRPGAEAGLVGNIQVGHFALQPAVLFSMKGYQKAGSALGLLVYGPARYEETVRLNYLTVPLNLAFSLRRDGQGFQAFAGPYVAMLVGGSYKRHFYYTSPPGSPTPVGGLPEATITQPVQASRRSSDADKYYTQRFDGGLQAGVGYRLKGLLVQANYSLGLRNLAVPYQSSYDGTIYDTPAYYNRAWQLSLSYLVGPGS